MITTLALLAALGTLATAQIVETIHHGSIFAKMRSYLEAVGGFWADLCGCPFCLSHWVAAWVTSVILPVAMTETCADKIWWLSAPIVAFAITRLSQLLNDYTHERCRTPRAAYDTTLVDLTKEFDQLGSRPVEDLTETRTDLEP